MSDVLTRETSGPVAARATGGAGPAVMRLEGVTKRYSEVVALDDVTVDIPTGSVVALVGANGAGKSTLLAVIAGLIRPTSGTVNIDGHAVDRGGGAGLSVGVLTHTTMLYGQLTGRENLELHARLRRLPSRRVDTVLAQAGLAHAADRPVGTYSHGMRKRLALARALLHDPAVLLLDEPFSGLEPASQERLADVVESLRGSTTVVFATHDLDRAVTHADTILRLDTGRVTAHEIRRIIRSSDTASRSDPRESRSAPAGVVRSAWAMLRKDVVVEARTRAVSSAVFVLAALLAATLGMAFEPLAGSPRAVSGILWVLIVFTALHALVRSFDEDFRDDALTGLLLSGADPAGIYLGRVASISVFLLGIGTAAAVAVAVLFASPSLFGLFGPLLAVVGLGAVGLAAVGAVLTVLARHTPLGETLLPLLLLPLAVPVLLGGIESVAILLETGTVDTGWLRVLSLYAVGMIAAGTIVFEDALEG